MSLVCSHKSASMYWRKGNLNSSLQSRGPASDYACQSVLRWEISMKRKEEIGQFSVVVIDPRECTRKTGQSSFERLTTKVPYLDLPYHTGRQ